MTLNEMKQAKAEEYAETLSKEYKESLVDFHDIFFLKEAIAKAYLAGLKAGRQEKWHDLRKNPKDLPAESQEVLVYFTLPDKSRNSVVIAQFKSNDFDIVDLQDVIAWYEIPTFEE